MMELACVMCRPPGLPNRYRIPVAYATGRDVSPSGLDVSPSGLDVSPSGLADRQHRPCGFWGGLLSFPVVFVQLWRLSVSSNGLDFHFGRWPISGGLTPVSCSNPLLPTCYPILGLRREIAVP